jgi:cellulose synthase/poly-beta-1,6-N-acetylglucosamine synthase-like glycosyltransferase
VWVWVLFASLALIVYAYAGYPLVCAVRARLSGRPLKRVPDFLPRVSVIIAAWREAATIHKKIESLAGQSRVPDEVVVVCDGSDDGTAEVARTAGDLHLPGRLKVLEKPRAGKPAALNAGLAQASGEVIVFTDARQPLSENAVEVLAADLGDDKVGAVGGALELAGDAPAGFYWKYEALIRKWEGQSGSTVGVSGALYAVKRALVAPLPDETILDDVLVPMRVRLQGYRVGFEPEAKAFDRAAESKRELARKVRTLSGNFQLLLLQPSLLVPFVNPSWFDFVSHKLLRLVVPWAMMLALLASALVPAPWSYGLVGAQLAGYSLALLSAAGLLRMRVAALCETLVVLNAAAVLALFRFLRHGRRLPWT